MDKGDHMKTLIMLSGIPASGKSTWAAKYQATHPNTFVISSDDVRVDVTGDYQDHSRQPEVWMEFSRRIHEFGQKEDVTVILDALNDVDDVREKYVRENPEFDRYILAIFPFDKEKSIKLNDEREWPYKVPNDILLKLIEKYEEPSQEIKKLFDDIQYIKWN